MDDNVVAIKNILKNILGDIDKSGRTHDQLSVVQCKVNKSLIQVAKQYLEEE